MPMPTELATELKRFPAVLGEDRVFPPKRGATGERQRVEGSFETVLELSGIRDFRFHDLRHTMASWYMVDFSNGAMSERSRLVHSLVLDSALMGAERFVSLVGPIVGWCKSHTIEPATSEVTGASASPLFSAMYVPSQCVAGKPKPTRSDSK